LAGAVAGARVLAPVRLSIELGNLVVQASDLQVAGRSASLDAATRTD
jgi:hypothetical protein